MSRIPVRSLSPPAISVAPSTPAKSAIASDMSAMAIPT